ncbi:hypothetical protein [Metabacillus halosaccharovorans]|uniref:hypothetical protein n=1 Tax=Metabacillus halosaccharovorans TaxID=930124 RepID=UPI001C1F3822|nr:hypothetical protein [Metabacillus halosaccharovorans]MBU7595166.1 hypothetical protein [Metabacillus halosaccharovorans]
MLRKASIVTLGLAVAITPGISVAAEEGSESVKQQAVVDTASEETATDAANVVVPSDETSDSEAVADEPTSNEPSETPTEENPAASEEEVVEEDPAAGEEVVEEEDPVADEEEVTEEDPIAGGEETEEDSSANEEDVVDEDEEEQLPELTDEEIVALMEGSVNGQVSEFNKEKGYYTLTINATVTNDSEQAISNFYTGVDIPDDIMVLDTDETPQDIYLLSGEETELAIPFGEVKAGETKNVSINIPVIGKTDGANLLQNINAYVIDGSYSPVGQIAGTSNLSFSTMSEATFFEGKAQAVTDFPGLADNQFGMQFGFKVQNLQIDSIDNVKIEFIVPNGVTIHEPDSYQEGAIPDALDDFLGGGSLGLGSSRLNLDWNGNTAFVDIGAIEAAGGYQGFFSAIGESSLSFEDIKNLKVKITLYSGNEAVESFTTPIELVKYEGNDDDSDNGSDNDSDNGSDNDGGTTPVVNKPTPTNSDNGNNSSNNSNNSGKAKDNNDSNLKVTPADNDDSDSEQGGKLPKTAGTNPVGVLMGGAIAAFGAALLAVRKRLFQ